jgi:hypothetical protein
MRRPRGIRVRSGQFEFVSRPTARVKFSKVALITPFNGVPNYDQIEWKRRFVEIYDQNKEGDWTVDYARIDETEELTPFQNPAKNQDQNSLRQDGVAKLGLKAERDPGGFVKNVATNLQSGRQGQLTTS